MAEINDLDIVDANNTARMPEGQAPSTVNNGVRALEGILARWHKDTNASKASTGSANAYVFAADQTLSAYYDGLVIAFDANFTNTGAATLNVDAVSADSIVLADGTALTGGEIVSGQKTWVVYNAAAWQLLNPARSDILETEQATTTGTAFDFTGIPADAREIIITFNNNSLSGTDDLLVQLGDSGGIETAGYGSTSVSTDGSTGNNTSATNGFVIYMSSAAAAFNGHMILTLSSASTNVWLASHSGRTSATLISSGGGRKGALTTALDRVRITRTGTDTFDLGALNITVIRAR